MTGGIVGGLARVYLPFTWGIPFIVFGYDLAANIQADVDILILCSTFRYIRSLPTTPFSLVLRKEYFDCPQRDSHAVHYI
jgi:hypothetical protein